MKSLQEMEAIYDAGKATIVCAHCESSKKFDQLYAAFTLLKADYVALSAEYQSLLDEYQLLKERVAKDSHNSSKPPSSDGLAKPKPKSLRTKSERHTGGQPGHEGHTLRMVEKPDWIVRHQVEQCSNCGRSLTGQQPDRVVCRQVHDLPKPKLEVTEHQAEVKICECGCVNQVKFPPDVTAPVQYGPQFKGAVTYLNEIQMLPFDRTTEVMRELKGCVSFSEGTIANIKASCSRRLKPVDTIIRNLLTAAPVVGFDETGVRAANSLHWLHSASTPHLTWYHPHKRRGSEAMDAGILSKYKGLAVHDGWKPYLKYGCDHALCNAHLLRELTFLWEEQKQKWANAMLKLLLDIKHAVAKASASGLNALQSADQERFRKDYERIIQAGYAENPDVALHGRKRSCKQSKARNLLDRFRDYRNEILAFMRNFAVPFDNNQAERDLRMMKLRQKISGTFRSIPALNDFCRIRSYVSTAQKNGVNAMDALQRVFAGDPFVPTVNTS